MTDFSLEFVFASGEKHSPKAEPSEWLLRSDADTVADSLTVRFSVGKRLFTEEPVGAVLKKDGAVIFEGIVDEHRVKCRNGARTEVFSLRSRAALLLDNEAAPMELRLPSLRLLERMYLMPLGLHAVGGDNGAVTDEVLGKVGETLEKLKEISVDVTVAAAVAVKKPVTVYVKPKDGCAFEDAKASCTAAITAYLNAFEVGEPFVTAGLIHAVMETGVAQNCTVPASVADFMPNAGEIVTAGAVNVLETQ